MRECDLGIPNYYTNTNSDLIKVKLYSQPMEGIFIEKKDDLIDEQRSFVAKRIVSGEVQSIEIYKFFDDEENWYHDRLDYSDSVIIYNNISEGTCLNYQPIDEFIENHEVIEEDK